MKRIVNILCTLFDYLTPPSCIHFFLLILIYQWVPLAIQSGSSFLNNFFLGQFWHLVLFFLHFFQIFEFGLTSVSLINNLKYMWMLTSNFLLWFHALQTLYMWYVCSTNDVVALHHWLFSWINVILHPFGDHHLLWYANLLTNYTSADIWYRLEKSKKYYELSDSWDFSAFDHRFIFNTTGKKRSCWKYYLLQENYFW